MTGPRQHRPLPWSDLLAGLFVWLAVLLVAGVFFCLVGQLIVSGARNVSFEFLTQSPRQAGRAGGIAPILVSTVLILLVSMAAAIPIGLGAACFLAETGADNHLTLRIVRGSVNVLAAIPSIVFGLFGNALFCVYLGMGFSILSGGLTLAFMALPLMIRVAEEGMRSVPLELRQSAACLGLSRAATWLWVVLPFAFPSLVAAVVLGFGRAAAETAALIFTSGYVDRMPRSLGDSGRSLSVHIYDLSMNVPGGDANASASALVLMSVVFLVNGSAAWMLKRQRRFASGVTS